MVDLHNHLLPGIDDGSRSMRETVNHLRGLHRAGTDLVVLTPHLLVPQLPGAALRKELCRQKARYDLLRHQLAGQRGLPRLRLGQEVLLPGAGDAERVSGTPGVGLGGSEAILIEFGFGPDYDACGVLRRLVDEGRTPVVAHAERYWFGDRDPLEEIRRWRDLGAVIQVNVGSLLDRYPAPAHSVAWAVVQQGLADLVASDHHGDSRPHAPGLVRGRLDDRLGRETTYRLLAENPARLLRGESMLGTEPSPRPGHAVA